MIINKKFWFIFLFLPLSFCAYLFFQPTKEFHSIDGKAWNWKDYPGQYAIVVYVQLNDWEELQPWLIYWSKKKSCKFIGLVDYLGDQSELINQHMTQLLSHKIFLLKKFDSSPYALMPMVDTPAAYLIDNEKRAHGPFNRYSDVPLSKA
jgi:hypothetical protein